MRFAASTKLTITKEDSTDGSQRETTMAMEESIKSVFRRDSLIGDPAHLAHLAKVTQAFIAPHPPNLASSLVRQASINEVESEQTHLCPKVDGRIQQINDEVRPLLLNDKYKIHLDVKCLPLILTH